MDEKHYVEPGPKADRIAIFLRGQGIDAHLKRDNYPAIRLVARPSENSYGPGECLLLTLRTAELRPDRWARLLFDERRTRS